MNKNVKIFLYSLPILGGIYIIYKQLTKNDGKPKPPPAGTEGGKVGIGSTGTGSYDPFSGFSKYIVNTASSDLNVRDTASTKGTVLTGLKKGTEILARASSTKGWSEYSTDGKVVYGYVSSQYLKKK